MQANKKLADKNSQPIVHFPQLYPTFLKRVTKMTIAYTTPSPLCILVEKSFNKMHKSCINMLQCDNMLFNKLWNTTGAALMTESLNIHPQPSDLYTRSQKQQQRTSLQAIKNVPKSRFNPPPKKEMEHQMITQNVDCLDCLSPSRGATPIPFASKADLER